MFWGTFKFPPRIPNNRKGGKLKTCQAAKWSFGEGAKRAWRPPTRYPRPPDRTGTHPGQPRPLTAAPHSTARSPPSTRSPPISATRPRLLYDPLPITALTLDDCGAAAAAARPTTNLLPLPSSQAQARITPQLGKRAGEGGGATTARGGARGWEETGAGLSSRLMIPASKDFPAPGQ